MNRREFSVAALATLGAACNGRADEVPQGVRFSVMLWALDKKLTFEQKVEVVAAAGYQGIELVGEFRAWSAEERRRVLALLRGKGLMVDSMSGVKAGFAVAAKREEFKTEVVELLKTANELACPQVILLSGDVNEAGREEQWKTSIENLKWAADEAAKAKIEIVIEPIDLLENPKIYLSTVSDAFRMAQEAGSPQLKVLYDLYHEQRSYGNLMEKLEKNIEHVGLIHVADVPGRHEPGTGEIRYEAIFRRLGELRYSRWIAMEFYPAGDAVGSLRNAREKAQTAMGEGTMNRRRFLPLLSGLMVSTGLKAQTKSAGGFDGAADAALEAMRLRAEELKIGGVAVVAAFEGDTIRAWSSKMLVVGRYKDEPKAAGDKGSNLLGIAYAKAAEMADTHKDSGSRVRPPMTGEFGWNGGVIGRTKTGWAIAAFSGGKGEDDVQVSRAGLARMGAVQVGYTSTRDVSSSSASSA